MGGGLPSSTTTLTDPKSDSTNQIRWTWKSTKWCQASNGGSLSDKSVPNDVATTDDNVAYFGQRPRGTVAMMATGQVGIMMTHWNDPAGEVCEVPVRISEVVVTRGQWTQGSKGGGGSSGGGVGVGCGVGFRAWSRDGDWVGDGGAGGGGGGVERWKCGPRWNTKLG